MAEDLDILKLQPSDNPGISLVTTLLDGSNFLSWSRSIKLALIAKTKLSFISKDAEIPEKDTKEFKQWTRLCLLPRRGHLFYSFYGSLLFVRELFLSSQPPKRSQLIKLEDI